MHRRFEKGRLEFGIRKHARHPVVCAELLELAIKREERRGIAPGEDEIQHVIHRMIAAYRFGQRFVEQRTIWKKLVNKV